MRRPPAVTVVLITALLVTVSGVNWAQFGGLKQQNTAVATASPFNGRRSHAVAVITNLQPDNAAPLPIPLRTRLFLLGGETYVGEESPDGQPAGTGTFRNDVFMSQLMEFAVVESLREFTAFGGLVPKVVSQLFWNQVALQALIPAGISYRDYMCCDATGVVDWGCEAITSCEQDSFSGTRRWLPRRGHTAVTALAGGVTPTLVVIGGLARETNTDVGVQVTLGGVVGIPQGGVPGERAVSRETAILMNDAWTSEDGRIWAVRNAGCFVGTPEYTPGRGRGPADTDGFASTQCASHADCVTGHRLGTSSTVACQTPAGAPCNGTTPCPDGRCVCSSFQPRHSHAAAVLDRDPPANSLIFVMGGATTVTTQVCAEFDCGGGYAVFLNDVWTSGDLGSSWGRLDPVGESMWSPRASFAVMVGGGYLWVLAGRGGATDDYATLPLYNDVWRASLDTSLPDTHLGANWTLHTAAAPFSPRAGATAVYGVDERLDELRRPVRTPQIVVAGGQELVLPSPSPSPLTPPARVAAAAAILEGEGDEEAAAAAAAAAAEAKHDRVDGNVMLRLDDVWTIDLDDGGEATGDWVLDYGVDTEWYDYVWPAMPLAHRVFNYSSTFLDAWAAVGVTTVEELATVDAEVVTAMKALVDDVCYHRIRAEALLTKCANQDVPYDGEFINDIVIVEGQDETGLTEPDRNGCQAELDAGLALADADWDMECLQRPSARHSGSMFLFEDWTMLLGGSDGPSSNRGDLWIRDGKKPETVITERPSDGSSDTVFDYAADEANTLFEYRLKFGDGSCCLRNWSLAAPPLDYKEWLDGGCYVFEVRAYDPAGNRDPLVEARNTHDWEYVEPLPLLLIILSIVAFLIIVIAIIFWWRRRKRKLALERYALKRRRRKLKAAKQGDWRNYHKKAVGDKRASKKAKRKARRDAKKGKKGKKSGRKSGRKSTGKSRSTAR